MILSLSVNSRKSKIKWKAILSRAIQKMAGIAESLADYHTYYGDANYINTEIERYRSVTREDIQRVAKKYLVKDNRVVLRYLPRLRVTRTS